LAGRTPAEAAKAFLGPLALALSCITQGKITTTPGGRNSAGEHAWTLNGGDGAPLGGEYLLKASMQYRIVEDDREGMGPWRVTTDGYMYSVEDQSGRERISWHWHPGTSGPHKAPHAHLNEGVISMEGSFLARVPLPSGRITFEECIRYLIGSLQLEPLHEDWRDRLAAAETPHKLYRTWHNDPGERNPKPST
jgi:hypothetical protein